MPLMRLISEEVLGPKHVPNCWSFASSRNCCWIRWHVVKSPGRDDVVYDGLCGWIVQKGSWRPAQFLPDGPILKSVSISNGVCLLFRLNLNIILRLCAIWIWQVSDWCEQHRPLRADGAGTRVPISVAQMKTAPVWSLMVLSGRQQSMTADLPDVWRM